MTHIEFIGADWCGPSVAMRCTLDELVAQFPGVKVRCLEAEELAVCPTAIPILRLVVDGKRVREHVGNQPESTIREFFEAANENS